MWVTSDGMIAIGDPRRLMVRRAIVVTLVVAAVFFVFTAPVKQVKPLYDHAPWLNDPYDTIVSFMMFFVPFIAICCLVRVLACRTCEPLPYLRVVDLLRGCRVVIVCVALTLLSEWIAVVVGANQAQRDVATWLQVGLLVVMTVLTGTSAVAVRRAATPIPRVNADGTTTADWVTDMVVIAKWQSGRLGEWHRPVAAMLDWLEQRPLRILRRHSLWSAVLACGSFGVAVGLNQGVREGYDVPSILMLTSLLGLGTFGLLVGAGSYLGLVRSTGHLHGTKRRIVDATVVTSIGVLVAFAFRYHLWWIVGSNNTTAGIPQLSAVLGIAAVLIFAVVLAGETLLRSHSEVTG